jgi:hypothetical protein
MSACIIVDRPTQVRSLGRQQLLAEEPRQGAQLRRAKSVRFGMFRRAYPFGPRARSGPARSSSSTLDFGGPMAPVYTEKLHQLPGMAGRARGHTAKVSPFASAYWVHEFEDQATDIGRTLACERQSA